MRATKPTVTPRVFYILGERSCEPHARGRAVASDRSRQTQQSGFYADALPPDPALQSKILGELFFTDLPDAFLLDYHPSLSVEERRRVGSIDGGGAAAG